MDGSRASPRYAHCIYADDESIKSVVTGEQPGSTDLHDILNPKAFVKVIDYQWSQHDDDEDDDDDHPPIDGCTRRDIGWMKVAAQILILRAYDVLSAQIWPAIYVRPPGMFED